jgi:hypothetical protein
MAAKTTLQSDRHPVAEVLAATLTGLAELGLLAKHAPIANRRTSAPQVMHVDHE